jgi:hypothetical protein
MFPQEMIFPLFHAVIDIVRTWAVFFAGGTIVTGEFYLRFSACRATFLQNATTPPAPVLSRLNSVEALATSHL